MTGVDDPSSTLPRSIPSSPPPTFSNIAPVDTSSALPVIAAARETTEVPTPITDDDAPSYHSSSVIGPSPSYTRQLRPSEQLLAQGAVRHRPSERYAKSGKLLSASLGGQEADCTMPSYGRAGLVDGVITLAPEALENALNLEVKIEGELKLVIAEGGATTHQLLSHMIPLFYSAIPSRCAERYTFAYRLPPRFEDEGVRRPLPPTYEVNLSGVPGVHAVVRYSITVNFTRQKLWKRKESLVIPFKYYPRSRPPQPVVGMSFLSSLKSNPEEWRLFPSTVRPRFPGAVDSVITSSLVLPSTNIFPMSRKIPFHLQLSLSPVKVRPTPTPKPEIASTPCTSTPSPCASTRHASTSSTLHLAPTSIQSPSSSHGLQTTSNDSNSPEHSPCVSIPSHQSQSKASEYTQKQSASLMVSLHRRHSAVLSSSSLSGATSKSHAGFQPCSQSAATCSGRSKTPSTEKSHGERENRNGTVPGLRLKNSLLRLNKSKLIGSTTKPSSPSGPAVQSPPAPNPTSGSHKKHQSRKQPDLTHHAGSTLMSPLLAQGAVIRVTLQRQISVGVRDQKVLKTIVCGEGYIRRVDLGKQRSGHDGQESAREHVSTASNQGLGVDEGDNEAGWFGTIPREDANEGKDIDNRSPAFDRCHPHACQRPPQAAAALSTPLARARGGDCQGCGVCDEMGNRQRIAANIQDDWAGWEGEVIPSTKQISVGGFRAAGLAVRDFIILNLIPRDPETSPLRTHQHAVPVRIVTDAWDADGEDD